MGLDMFLTKKHYIWDKDKSHMKIVVDENATDRAKKLSSLDMSKVSYIYEEVAYWRKANQIHKWFIDHCADGDGDRTVMTVMVDELEHLLKDVNTVLDSIKLVEGDVYMGSKWTKETGEVKEYKKGKIIADTSVAEELLPTESGFFFGATDYDEYYIEQLENTRDVLIEILKDEDADEFEYVASW